MFGITGKALLALLGVFSGTPAFANVSQCPGNEPPDFLRAVARHSGRAEEVTSEVYDSCSTTPLSAADQRLRQTLQTELARAAEAVRGRSVEEHKRAFAAVLKRHEKSLTGELRRSIIADSNRRTVERVLQGLQRNRALRESYSAFIRETKVFRENQRKWFHGLGTSLLGGDLHAKESAAYSRQQEAALAAIREAEGLDPNTRRLLTLTVQQTAGESFKIASQGALENARRATNAIGAAKVVAGTAATVELAAAAWFTGGLAGNAAAVSAKGTTAAIWGLVWGAASGASSGAVVGGGLAGTKLLTTAMLRTNRKEGNDFFCRLAQEVEDKGETVVNEALVGAAMGAFFGGAGTVAGKGAQIAMKGAGKTMMGVGAAGAARDGKRLLELRAQAQRAAAVGNEAEAARLLEEMKVQGANLALDAGSMAGGWATWARKALALRGRTVTDANGKKLPWFEWVKASLGVAKAGTSAPKPDAPVAKPKPPVAAREAPDLKASSEVVEQVTAAKGPDGMPLFTSQDRAILLGVDPQTRLTVRTEDIFGTRMKAREMTAEEVIALSRDRNIQEVTISAVEPPPSTTPLAEVSAKLHEVDLPSDPQQPLTVTVEFASGHHANYSGNRDMVLNFARSPDVRAVRPEAPDWRPPATQDIPATHRGSDHDAVAARIGKISPQLKSDSTSDASDIAGMRIYHGTIEPLAASVKAGPKNVGKGLGGSGLYLAVDGDRGLAKYYSERAISAAGNRAASSGVALEAGSVNRSVILEGRINPAKNLKVGTFRIKAHGAPDLTKGELPPRWADDPVLAKALEKEFDVLDIRDAATGGRAANISDRFLVVHERAGADAILWEAR